MRIQVTKFVRKINASGCWLVWLVAAAMFCPNFSKSQDSLHITPGKSYTLYETPRVAALREKYIEYNRKKEYFDGYRIQVTYTNVRDEVYQGKGAMYKQFPELASYVEYEQPYYKLRIGDFTTRLEATYYLQQVILLYPGAFIVKDKIKEK